MERGFMIETEFLFGFQPKDKHYDIVSNILRTYAEAKHFPLHYPVSALVEIREALTSHKRDVAERLNALAFIKAKAISSGLLEIELSSDDLILCEHLLAQHRFLTFFDGLHAAVALNSALTVISNDQVYSELGIQTLSFEGFLDFLKKQFQTP